MSSTRYKTFKDCYICGNERSLDALSWVHHPWFAETVKLLNHQTLLLPYTGNIWQGKILANYAGKSYWRGKIWRISNSQCTCHIHFPCICEYWRGKSWRMVQNLPNSLIFSPTKIFPCTVYGMHQICVSGTNC